MSLIILQSADSKEVYIWPPGGKQPISVPRKTRGLEVLRDGTIEMSATAISNAVLRDAEQRKPAIVDDHPLLSRAPDYVARTQWYQDFQQRLVIIAGVGLFGASTAYGAYWQVLASDFPGSDNTANDLFKSFLLFIYSSMLAFGAQVSSGALSNLIAFALAFWYAAAMAVGVFYLVRATNLVSATGAGGLVFGGIGSLCIPLLVVGYRAARAKCFTPRRHGRRTETAPRMDPEYGAASDFIGVFDLYGGVLEYLNSRVPQFASLGVKEQAVKYVTAIEAYFPPGFVCQARVDWHFTRMDHAQRHLTAARRWYRPAEELRRLALPTWTENTMHHRVHRLLVAEQLLSGPSDAHPAYAAEATDISHGSEPYAHGRFEAPAGSGSRAGPGGFQPR